MWNQDRGNAQRTSASPITPTLPWTYKWGWNGPNSTAGTRSAYFYDAWYEGRPISGNGRVYVPTGKQPNSILNPKAQPPYAIYCLNGPSTNVFPSAQTLWTGLAGKDCRASPAYDPVTDTLLVGCVDGIVYQLRGSDGVQIGSYNALSPIRKALLLVGRYVYCVCDDGTLHKISINTMTLAWAAKYSAGAQAQTPPTFSNSLGYIVYCAGDQSVHCVGDSNGLRVWRAAPYKGDPTQITDPANFFGSSFAAPANQCITWHGTYPVIAEKHQQVFVTLRTEDDRAGTGWPVMPTGVNTIAQIRSAITTTQPYAGAPNSAIQSKYALDLKTGAQSFVPALFYNAYEIAPTITPTRDSFGTPIQMPCIVQWANGDEVAYETTRTFVFAPDNGEHNAAVVEMMLDGSTVAGLNAGDFRYIRYSKYDLNDPLPAYAGPSYQYCSDEVQSLQMFGTWLVSSRWDGDDFVEITNRASTLGGTWTNPITANIHPAFIHGTYDPTIGDANVNTHFWVTGTGQLNESGAPTRQWVGQDNGAAQTGVWWGYWNQMFAADLFDANWVNCTLIDGNMLYIVGTNGEIAAFQHSGTTTAVENLATHSPNVPQWGG